MDQAWRDELPFTGLYEVIFVNGLIQHIDIKVTVVDTNNRPLYLWSKDGQFVNWMTVISIKKVG